MSKMQSETRRLEQESFSQVMESSEQVCAKQVKISIIGAGKSGMSILQTLLAKRWGSEFAIVDKDENKLKGELLDFQHCAGFLPKVCVYGSTDCEVTKNSEIVILATGVRVTPECDRSECLKKNLEHYKTLIPELMKHSPDCILLVVSSPVDAMTKAAWKFSGLPRNRVIGVGTHVDSSRFQYLVGDTFGVNPKNVQAFVLGGQESENLLPIWSRTHLAGSRVFGEMAEKTSKEDIAKKLNQGTEEILKLKGYTDRSIGFSVATLVERILDDQHMIEPISTCAEGHFGIEECVFLSLPVVLCRQGVASVFKMEFEEDELNSLKKVASREHDFQKVIESERES
jgi:L-lactate dehydrogenase